MLHLAVLALSSCAPELAEGMSPGDCTDLADNDGDGAFDCDDEGCAGSPECEEADADTDSDTDTDADSDTDSDTDTDADSDTDSDTDTDADSDTDYTVCSSGGSYSTIQDAIDAAADGDTITICAGTYTENLVITDPLALLGVDGAAATVIDGGGTDAVVEILAFGEVGLEGVTLTNGGSTDYAALASQEADVVLQDCLVTGNVSDIATILIESGSLSATDTEISGNEAAQSVGLYVDDADVTLVRVAIIDNIGTGHTWGSQVYWNMTGGSTEVFNVVVYGNDSLTGLFTVYGDDFFMVNSILDMRDAYGAVATSDTFGASYTNITVYNSYFKSSYSSSTGVHGVSRASTTVEYSAFSGVYWPLYGSTSLPDTCLDDAPRFVDEEAHVYTLDSFSPLIDAGNPASAFDDPDGTTNDIGIYGGPYSW